jgi:MFS family permease
MPSPAPSTPPAAKPPADRPAALGALGQRDFRLLWLGLIVSNTGAWMQQVTASWLLWELTHSPLLLGVYGLCRSLPFIATSLYAGALADRVDRRLLLLIANAVNALFPLALGILAALGRVEPWHIYLAAALSAMVDSFDLPARQALIPALVPRAQLMAALGLVGSLRRATSLLGPSLGGVVVVWMGIAGAFFLNAASFGAVVLAAALMRTRPPRAPASGSALAMIGEGLVYVARHPLLGTLLGVEALVTLCTSYQGILPVFADAVLGVGPAGLGLLMSAPGLGAILGSAGLVSRGDVAAKGRFLLVTGGLFGLALLVFATSRVFVLSVAALVAVGLLDTVYGAVRNTIVQLAAAEQFRGRVVSLQTLTQRGLGPSGNFVTGSLATVVGAPAAVAILALVATGLVLWRGWRFPALREFRTG